MNKKRWTSSDENNNELKAKNFYRPLIEENICFGNEDLGTVLDRIEEDLGSLIAFNEDKDFIGVVSSYKTVYKSQNSPRKKIQNAVFQPMIITKDTPLYKIAEFMAFEKVYLLPVFNQDEVIGTISAVDIVKRILHDENLKSSVAEEIISDDPITEKMNAKVKDVYPLLKANGVSEVLIVDKVGKVCGVVKRSDIKHAFIHPTDKQRFHKDNNRNDDWSFDTEKRLREDDPIRNYLTEYVPTTHETSTNQEKVLALLNADSDFIVITDKASRPTGILSYRNILQAIAKLKPEDEVNIIFEKPSQNVTQSDFAIAYEDLNRFVQKMNRKTLIERVEVRIQEPKYATKQTAEFEITLQIDPLSGGQFIAHSKSKIFGQSLRFAMKQIEKQFQKDHAIRKSHNRKSLSESSTEVMLKRMYR